MGFLNNLLYCLWIFSNTHIAASPMVLPGLVGMGPEIGSAGGRSIRTGWKPSRYWDAAVPLADSSGLRRQRAYCQVLLFQEVP